MGSLTQLESIEVYIGIFVFVDEPEPKREKKLKIDVNKCQKIDVRKQVLYINRCKQDDVPQDNQRASHRRLHFKKTMALANELYANSCANPQQSLRRSSSLLVILFPQSPPSSKKQIELHQIAYTEPPTSRQP